MATCRGNVPSAILRYMVERDSPVRARTVLRRMMRSCSGIYEALRSKVQSLPPFARMAAHLPKTRVSLGSLRALHVHVVVLWVTIEDQGGSWRFSGGWLPASLPEAIFFGCCFQVTLFHFAQWLSREQAAMHRQFPTKAGRSHATLGQSACANTGHSPRCAALFGSADNPAGECAAVLHEGLSIIHGRLEGVTMRPARTGDQTSNYALGEEMATIAPSISIDGRNHDDFRPPLYLGSEPWTT